MIVVRGLLAGVVLGIAAASVLGQVYERRRRIYLHENRR